LSFRRCGSIRNAVVAMSRVPPSGSARATDSAPTIPFPPGRFSTIRVTPSDRLTCSASKRAGMSEGLPAVYGTTSFIVRWACAHTPWPDDIRSSEASAGIAVVRLGNHSFGHVMTGTFLRWGLQTLEIGAVCPALAAPDQIALCLDNAFA